MKQTRQVITWMEKFHELSLTSFECETDTISVRMTKEFVEGTEVTKVSEAQKIAVMTKESKETIETEEIKEEVNTEERTYTVTAPMVGIYYSKPSPDEPSYVEEGQTVTEGDPLCVLESMKLFNEVEATKCGKVVNVYKQDGDFVEFGDALFEIQLEEEV